MNKERLEKINIKDYKWVDGVEDGFICYYNNEEYYFHTEDEEHFDNYSIMYDKTRTLVQITLWLDDNHYECYLVKSEEL